MVLNWYIYYPIQIMIHVPKLKWAGDGSRILSNVLQCEPAFRRLTFCKSLNNVWLFGDTISRKQCYLFFGRVVEFEYIMEFPLIHFNVLIEGLSGYDIVNYPKF